MPERVSRPFGGSAPSSNRRTLQSSTARSTAHISPSFQLLGSMSLYLLCLRKCAITRSAEGIRRRQHCSHPQTALRQRLKSPICLSRQKLAGLLVSLTEHLKLSGASVENTISASLNERKQSQSMPKALAITLQS